MEEAERTQANSRLNLSVMVAAYLVAVLGYLPPQLGRPIDFHFVLNGSLPLAGVWAVILAFCFVRSMKSGLLALLGAPLALYWPIWLLFNRIPDCHWHGNCI